MFEFDLEQIYVKKSIYVFLKKEESMRIYCSIRDHLYNSISDVSFLIFQFKALRSLKKNP
jgi:hypothetical protein